MTPELPHQLLRLTPVLNSVVLSCFRYYMLIKVATEVFGLPHHCDVNIVLLQVPQKKENLVVFLTAASMITALMLREGFDYFPF